MLFLCLSLLSRRESSLPRRVALREMNGWSRPVLPAQDLDRGRSIGERKTCINRKNTSQKTSTGDKRADEIGFGPMRQTQILRMNRASKHRKNSQLPRGVGLQPSTEPTPPRMKKRPLTERTHLISRVRATNAPTKLVLDRCVRRRFRE